MQNNSVELRSDTFTKPTKAMLESMFSAAVGDDVFEEDATTTSLEKKCAAMFGYAAALFCVSGTMANQIAIKAHTQPGDELICDALSHIYLYEGGGIASNSLVSVQLLHGDRGRINATQISDAIQPDNVHYPISKLVCLENTVNKGGGCYYNILEIEAIKKVCNQNDLRLHLDGARLMNALVANGESMVKHGRQFDSISLCLSKGLGAPMGSIIMGSASFIKQCRRVRKRFGGGWRQSGYMAAAGIYALDNHILRLAEDHARAKQLGEIFKNIPLIRQLLPIETNIVIAELEPTILAQDFVNKLIQLGIQTAPFGKHKFRMVTHLDFTDDDLQKCAEAVKNLV
jgi:threonine aldolase